MFERIGRLAERAANGVSLSRRGFFGRLGQGALTTAGVLVGLLPLSSPAKAGGNILYACNYFVYHGRGRCYFVRYCGSLTSCGECPGTNGTCCKLFEKVAIGTC
jgi:hypothetical protein